MPSDLEKYEKLRAEYHITLRVLALLVEQVAEGEEAIVISDEALLKAPDLFAWRDEQSHQIALQVKRG